MSPRLARSCSRLCHDRRNAQTGDAPSLWILVSPPLVTIALTPPDSRCNAVSGKTSRDRTQLAAMLNYLRQGDVVVVVKLDRLSRSLMDLLRLSEEIRAKGTQLRSLSEDLDTTTHAGKLIFHVMGVLAEYERERIRERTSRVCRQPRSAAGLEAGLQS